MEEGAPAGVTPGGRVGVAQEVVAGVAARAALEVEGVAGLCDPGLRVSRLLHHQHAHRGVELDMIGGAGIRLELYLAMRSEATLPQITEEVERRVTHQLQWMLGLQVLELNLHIVELDEG